MTSQFNEDAIIADIFAKVGTTNKRFIEFGSGDGRQTNTGELLRQGWSGLWLEPRKKRVRHASRLWRNFPVDVRRRAVTTGNINKIVTESVDFLSIDIDGEDYAVWEALQARPRVVCIECDPVNGTDLDTMTELGRFKGYRFLRTSRYGINAFFLARPAYKPFIRAWA